MLIHFNNFSGEDALYKSQRISIWSQTLLASTIQGVIDQYESAATPSQFLAISNLDSSFLLFDNDKNIVVAAKDFFGISPLFFSLQPKNYSDEYSIRFSFSVKDLVNTEGFVRELNLTKIKNYLSWEKRSELVGSQTFYKGIYRLLPAHGLVITNGHLSIFPYSKLNLHQNKGKANHFFTSSFEQRFVSKIKKYISSETKLATSLSGGLDSSSITAVAQSLSQKPILAFHIHVDSPFAQEKKYALTIVEKWKPDFRENPPPIVDYNHVKTMITDTATLPWGVLPDIGSLYFKEPAKQGCNVLLMGEGGDQVLGMSNTLYYDELYNRKAWKALKEAFRAYANQRIKAAAETPGVIAQNFQLSMLATRFFYEKIKTARSINEKIHSAFILLTYFEGYRQNIVWWILQKLARKKIVSNGDVVEVPLFRNDIAINEFAVPFCGVDQPLDVQQLCEQPLTTNHRNHINGCYHEALANVLEEINYLTRKVVNIKVDFPFLDKELLELCLTVPNTLRFYNGLGRGLLRQSMKKYLSPEVQNRGWKAHFSDYSLESFHVLWRAFRQERNFTAHKVWEIVDKAQFDRLLHLIETGKSGSGHRWQAIRVIYLALWLSDLDHSDSKGELRY